MDMINVKDLISELQKKNINLGKGNPYNRLRYYTKIGWIDHMVRKKDSKGIVVGHYPLHVVEKLVLIENLKKQNKSNDEITKLLHEEKSNNKTYNPEIIKFLKNKLNINTIILLLILFGFGFELLNYNSLHDKLPINKEITGLNNLEIKIEEKGRNMIQSGKNKIFINSKKVNEKSTILVTFEESIEPANHYFISEKIIQEGFTIELNLPLKKDVHFNWLIIN